MKSAELCLGLVVAGVFALAGTGCVVTESAGPPGVVAGDIVLTWSIDGDASGSSCGSHDAALIFVTITDPAGAVVDQWKVPCTSEGTDETLPPGNYAATAQLEDSTGAAITTADPTQFSIFAYSSSVPIDFDFEEDSFTNGT